MTRFTLKQYLALKWISIGVAPLGFLLVTIGREGTLIFYFGAGLVLISFLANLLNLYQNRDIKWVCHKLIVHLSGLILVGLLVVYIRWFS